MGPLFTVLNFFIFLKNKKNMKNIQKKKNVSSFFILKNQIQITQNLENRKIFVENTKIILKNYF